MLSIHQESAIVSGQKNTSIAFHSAIAILLGLFHINKIRFTMVYPHSSGKKPVTWLAALHGAHVRRSFGQGRRDQNREGIGGDLGP